MVKINEDDKNKSDRDNTSYSYHLVWCSKAQAEPDCFVYHHQYLAGLRDLGSRPVPRMHGARIRSRWR